MLGESLLELIEWDFELPSDLEYLFRVRFKVEVVFCSYAGCFNLNFVSSWILMNPDAVPSAFWGDNPNKQD